jgi:8-oxo-dGTP pyrophosphatase MutT (NUDIX family)
MSRSYCFCNNCGKGGHAFHQCKHPITSAGVIAFRPGADGPEYLMIRRKDTLGFVDFVRGKYPLHGRTYLMNIINEMTVSEKRRLLNDDFAELWSQLWGASVGIQYRGEERVSREKFEALRRGVTAAGQSYDLASLVRDSETGWGEPEWGFPKGRRNYQERDLHCALREFEEETGYPKESLQVVQNLMPLEEIFTGSNYKSYKHRYFLALLRDGARPGRPFQSTEVSKVEWKPSREVLRCIRPYNLEKKAVAARADALLRRYRLYP